MRLACDSRKTKCLDASSLHYITANNIKFLFADIKYEKSQPLQFIVRLATGIIGGSQFTDILYITHEHQQNIAKCCSAFSQNHQIIFKICFIFTNWLKFLC